MNKIRNRILAMFLIIMILFTNYGFVLAVSLPYVDITNGTNGNQIKSIAKIIDSNLYLDGSFSAKSIPVSYSDIKIYNYGTKTKQTQVGSVVLTNDDVGLYSPGQYYLKERNYSTTNILEYSIKIPASTETINNVATIIYENGLQYEGQSYDVAFNIKEIRKNSSEDVVVGVRMGSRTASDSDVTDISTYTNKSTPSIHINAGAFNAEIEVDMNYTVLKNDTPVAISGIWRIKDIDNNEGMLIKNFQPNSATSTNPNVFIKSEDADLESINQVYYTTSGNDFFIYSQASLDNDDANVFLKMENVSSINMLKTWNKRNAGIELDFLDNQIQTYHKITTSVTGGTITPSINNIENGQNKTITYSPNPGMQLDSIEVDGSSVSIGGTNATQYTFSGIMEDHTIKVTYVPIEYNITYELNGGQNDPDNPNKYTVEDRVVFKDATNKVGHDFIAWYEDAEFTKPITELPVGTTGDKKLYAKWQPKNNIPYTVEHYKKQKNGTYSKETTENLTGTYNQNVTATAQQYTGYAENQTHPDRIPSGNIALDGSLVLRLYYDPIIYNITYELNGGQNDSRNPDTYTVNDNVVFKDATNKIGHDFIGWYEDEGFTRPITELPVGTTGNKKLYAKWQPKSNIPYTVEHYKKQKNGTYSKEKTENLTGTFNETVTATPQQFTGYAENQTHPDRIPSGNIAADGSLVLRLYYDPIIYNITYELNGGQNDPDNPNTYTVEDRVVFKDATNKVGHDFIGWYEDEGFTRPITELPVGTTGNKKLYAKWQPKSNIPYTVEHYKKQKNGTYSKEKTENLTGTFNETVTATPQQFTGYAENQTHPDRIPSGNIAADGGLVLRLYYDPIIYNITYELNGGQNNPSNPDTYTVQDNVVFQPATDKIGYDFIGWYEDAEFTRPITELPVGTTGDKTIFAKWKEKEGLQYTVEHYKKQKDGTYIIDTTENLTGTYNKAVTATPKQFVGYAENQNHPDRIPSGNIAVDGSLILRLYYDPIVYNITYELNGGQNNPSNPDTYTVQDNVVFQPATNKIGYNFIGWYEDAEFTKPITELPVGTTGDKTIYAKWKEKDDIPYTVEHYKKQKDGTYKKEETEGLIGTYNTTATATPKQFAGYEENQNHPDRIPSGIIVADGSLVLKLYYDQIIYNIKYELDGGTNNPENPEKYTVDDKVTFKPATKPDNEFKGWYEDPEFTKPITELSEGTIGDKIIYAKWKVKDVAYKVEHYKKRKNDKYELVLTDSLIGKSGTTIVATPKEFIGFEENKTYKDRISSGIIKEDGSLVLKLYYDPIIYKIKYELDGGTNDPQNPETYTVEDNYTFKPAVKEGFVFKGWYEDNEFKKPIVDLAGKTGDITVYAKWDPSEKTEYKVEHHKQKKDGKYELESVELYTGKTDTEVVASPKQFDGYKENTIHPDRIASGKIKPDGSLVLKLYYDINMYTVTFDPQNGGKIPDQKVPYNDKSTEPNTPVKDNYKFQYWYYQDENGKEKKYDFDTPVTSDIKIIAKWQPTKSAPETLPKTGIMKFLGISCIIGFSALAIVSWKKYKNINIL